MNVESALLLTQAFAPGVRERGFGRVVFIVSNTFWRPPGAHMLAYVASKGALIGMTPTPSPSGSAATGSRSRWWPRG
ncbi:SDR family NAD(P)-dependent oxidoreductase [Streptomyces lavendulae]|uniref:SDR family NAD(P)-dependent oxidoreductase n=1 Tax=Streptomyces lavendulae TaxID=1914 RepID=UPI0036AB49F4